MHKKDNWIPASIPPAQDGLYLTTIQVSDGQHAFKYLHIEEFREGIWEKETDIVTILAWQPLPAVYKAGD